MMNEEQAFVFVVDDDVLVRDSIDDLLRSVGFEVRTFASAQEFLRSERRDVPSCIVLDVRLPGASGLEFHRTLAQSNIPHPVIFISGHADVSMSVRAMPTRICLSALSKTLLGTSSMFLGEAAYSKERTSKPFTASKSWIPEAKCR